MHASHDGPDLRIQRSGDRAVLQHDADVRNVPGDAEDIGILPAEEGRKRLLLQDHVQDHRGVPRADQRSQDLKLQRLDDHDML